MIAILSVNLSSKHLNQVRFEFGSAYDIIKLANYHTGLILSIDKSIIVLYRNVKNMLDLK